MRNEKDNKLTPAMATPMRRRRLVIEESSSSDESNVFHDVDESFSAHSSSILGSDDEYVGSPKQESQVDDGLATIMSRVKISDNSLKTESIHSKSRTCTRGGIDSLIFDSDDDDDSETDDSSFLEPYVPIFKPKARNQVNDSSIEIVKTNKNVEQIEKNGDNWSFHSSSDEYWINSASSSSNLRVPAKLFRNLFDHQKDGVFWMAGLHSKGIGGLLGDDMGMGKTYMTLTCLGGLMRAKTIKNALIVAPLSVLRSWESEAHKVAKVAVPNISIQVLSSDITKATRVRRLQDALECSSSCPHLIITTYGLVRSSTLDFVHDYCTWDYIVLDEAHQIKNPSSEVSKSCRRIARPTETRRIILTGTPIMNNLKELWSLFDFATSGKVLGKLPSFTNRFAKPIEDARSIDANSHDLRLGKKANEELQVKLRPYFLQRLKIDFLADKLPKKQDFVVWIQLSKQQRAIYADYVESGSSAVAQILSGTTTSPLEAVTWLKKLCGHPILIAGGDYYSKSINNNEVEKLKRNSSKLQVLDILIEQLRNQGHRTLIFSQSTKMLDIIEKVLKRVKLSRIDGSTREKERQRLVDDFNSSYSSAEVMLLSTKAAGIGLTLTGADRAIIFDPSWNPAEDSQAVDRCYRIGQTKEVKVFRFITAGSVEEKMYEKQVHKDGIRRAVMTSMGSSTTRYFDKDGLRSLFTLGSEGKCEFFERLKERGLASDENSPESKLVSYSEVIGVSSHDYVYKANSMISFEDDTTGDEKNDNPFSVVRAQPMSVEIQEGQVSGNSNSKKILGRSQRALQKGKTAKNGKIYQLGKPINDKMQEKENSGGNVSTANEESNHQSDTCFTEMINRAEKLKQSGNPVKCIEILMDMLEGKIIELSNDQKMKVHEQIAVLANQMQWL